MITAIRRRLEDREEGFTLIELLVVVIIIGILAAIAIPTFMRQRERGWEAAAQSELRNAAVAQESVFTAGQSYVVDTDFTDGVGLDLEGYNNGENVTLTVVSANTTGYCMQAQHDSGGQMYYLDSATGEARVGDCATDGIDYATLAVS